MQFWLLKLYTFLLNIIYVNIIIINDVQKQLFQYSYCRKANKATHVKLHNDIIKFHVFHF